ncbi:alpha/beta fold hydrolase [Umezawaea endophytica]|uniref:Alpha/beta hydrolase n=1 Tax=Umezawaea endophytica TaxID=1654476 RepID=A0A9X3AFH2_9PSEU|nr:alpha/beta hydrolase [Umezawaea endophytica]MCS7477195.1 alpha/beta hydrolase [Umezawaea endophytica]
MRKFTLISAVALVAGLVATALPLSFAAADTAAAERHGAPKPTVVLVHGAFAESASWNGVVSRLRDRGYPVIAVANQLRSLDTDVAYVKAVLAGVEGPVVLAGHSYGGMVISGAATGNPNVKSLAYIAAFAPEAGESALDLTGKFPGSTLPPTLNSIPLGDGTNDLTIRQDLFREQFAADVPRQEAALMAATQRPIRDAALTGPAGAPAWRAIPSWFLIPTADKNIPLEAQRFMAKRADARGVVELRGASHAVTVSRPAEVADLITRAAR